MSAPNLFNDPPAEGHLAWFPFAAILNGTVMDAPENTLWGVFVIIPRVCLPRAERLPVHPRACTCSSCICDISFPAPQGAPEV